MKTPNLALLSRAIEYWMDMPEDDLEEFRELPAYMQEEMMRLAFYAYQVPELFSAITELEKFATYLCSHLPESPDENNTIIAARTAIANVLKGTA